MDQENNTNNKEQESQNSKIRIQPKEVCVPSGEPFKFDQIGREQTAKILTRFIGAIEGPGVLAIDAPWGAGKTTFLNMCKQYLHNEGFPVVMFNAWENDFSGNPFVSLTAELTKGLGEYGESVKTKIERVKRWSKLVSSLVRVVGTGLSTAADVGVDAGGVAAATGTKLSELAASQVEERLESYWSAKESEVNFKESLQDMACTLSQSSANRPLIVIIDELDRCRPTYAIELLETAKHLFSVDNIVFVLGINIGEMSHSIRALYGSRFDAEGYLRRFIDLDFRLTDPAPVFVNMPGRKKYINEMFKVIQYDEYFSRTKDSFNEYGKRVLFSFFSLSAFSLRDIAQALLRLGLVFLSLQEGKHSPYILAIITLLIIRTLDKNLYHQFVNGEITDKDLADAIFKQSGLQRHAPIKGYNYFAYYEALIIKGAQEFRQPENTDIVKRIESDLLQWHRKIASDKSVVEEARQYSEEVIQFDKNWEERPQRLASEPFRRTLGFKFAAQRLELQSHEFLLEE